MIKRLFRKKNTTHGFTLIEVIVTLALLTSISLACISILSSGLAAKADIDMKLKEQVAIRQVVIAVTRDIRMEPEQNGVLGPLAGRYALDGTMLVRSADSWGARQGSVVGQNIADFSIVVDGGDKGDRAIITVQSTGRADGTGAHTVQTQIYLRIGSNGNEDEDG
jgi:prepilin-type N-terminal cleavage/methylation domain-containing protein